VVSGAVKSAGFTRIPAADCTNSAPSVKRHTRTRFLVIPVPSICLACSNRSRSKSTRTCFLKIQPRRRSAQRCPDAFLYNFSLYPLFVRAAMVDRESSIFHASSVVLKTDGIIRGIRSGWQGLRSTLSPALTRALQDVPYDAPDYNERRNVFARLNRVASRTPRGRAGGRSAWLCKWLGGRSSLRAVWYPHDAHAAWGTGRSTTANGASRSSRRFVSRGHLGT
jgi:hypothetical protein